MAPIEQFELFGNQFDKDVVKLLEAYLDQYIEVFTHINELKKNLKHIGSNACAQMLKLPRKELRYRGHRFQVSEYPNIALKCTKLPKGEF